MLADDTFVTVVTSQKGHEYRANAPLGRIRGAQPWFLNAFASVVKRSSNNNIPKYSGFYVMVGILQSQPSTTPKAPQQPA